MADHRIIVVNPGSTSTKFALYENERALFVSNLRHSELELEQFRGRPILDQKAYRRDLILDDLAKKGHDIRGLSAAVGRGGLLRPLTSGTYLVNQVMLDELTRAERGEHASNLGAFLAQGMAENAGASAFVVDPVSVDEWPAKARLSGCAQLDRQCLSHALNTKAVAKRFARDHGRPYDQLRLIVAHVGSGISVSGHMGGRMVDVTNSREEGAFSTERSGTVPAMRLVELCFSGKYTPKQVEALLFREGGLQSYLGTKDLVEVEKRVLGGDSKAELVYNAMVYQIAKEVGAMATVLAGQVDAILLTGGMSHSVKLVAELSSQIQWIAPVKVYPGEDELQALAEGALRVLRGEEPALQLANLSEAVAT